MNKAVVGAVALGVVAIGAGTGFAAWSGGRVAHELQSRTTELLAPFDGVKVVENKVESGLFSSVHTVTLEVGCAPAPEAGAAANSPVQITWRDHIQHGPLPGGRAIGLAAIDTELVLPPDVAARLAQVFGNQPPVRVHTLLGFDQRYVAEVSSPAFRHAEAGKGDIDWQGVRATLRGRLDGVGAGEYEFEAPGMAVNFAADGQTAGSMRLGRMTMQGSMTRSEGGSWLLAAGQGRGTIESLGVTTQSPGGKPVEVRFDQLAFTSEAKVDNGLVSAVTTMSMTGKFDDFPIDKVEMKASLSRLHAATYEQLMAQAFKSSFSCNAAGGADAQKLGAAVAEQMQQGLAALLVHNPEYALDRLAVQVGGKTAELSYRLGTRGITEADAALPMPALMMTKGYGAATVKLENGWLEQVVRKVVAMKPSEDGSTPEEATAQAMASIQVAIDDLVAKGLLVREAGGIATKATFEGGMVKVNDQPMNLPIGMLAQ